MKFNQITYSTLLLLENKHIFVYRAHAKSAGHQRDVQQPRHI